MPNMRSSAGDSPVSGTVRHDVGSRDGAESTALTSGGPSLTWLGHATAVAELGTSRVVFDPLLPWRARAAGRVDAILVTHSHVDHFGGVEGVTTTADVKAGRVRIVAPDGFLDAAVSENVIAGPAMARRGLYMYGASLPRAADGQVDAGLGKTTSEGNVSVIAPTQGSPFGLGAISRLPSWAGVQLPWASLLYFSDESSILANAWATMSWVWSVAMVEP